MNDALQLDREVEFDSDPLKTLPKDNRLQIPKSFAPDYIYQLIYGFHISKKNI